MTDREMLEFAAKAAGYTLTWGEKYLLGDDEVDCSDIPYIKSNETDVSDAYWNPLIDDGDALRLAVKLGIDFYEGEDDGKAAYAGYYAPRSNTRPQRFMVERHNDHADPYAATRLAITRAAAEIGRTMP